MKNPLKPNIDNMMPDVSSCYKPQNNSLRDVKCRYSRIFFTWCKKKKHYCINAHASVTEASPHKFTFSCTNHEKFGKQPEIFNASLNFEWMFHERKY